MPKVNNQEISHHIYIFVISVYRAEISSCWVLHFSLQNTNGLVRKSKESHLIPSSSRRKQEKVRKLSPKLCQVINKLNGVRRSAWSPISTDKRFGWFRLNWCHLEYRIKSASSKQIKMHGTISNAPLQPQMICLLLPNKSKK